MATNAVGLTVTLSWQMKTIRSKRHLGITSIPALPFRVNFFTDRRAFLYAAYGRGAENSSCHRCQSLRLPQLAKLSGPMACIPAPAAVLDPANTVLCKRPTRVVLNELPSTVTCLYIFQSWSRLSIQRFGRPPAHQSSNRQ